MTTQPIIKRALLSTSNKIGLVDFAKQLAACDIELIATGGTAALLKQSHIPVIEISEYTHFPEILEGRVKTLHPKIYGGLLARGEQDSKTLAQLEIDKIDLVVVNLYPFQETIAKNNCLLQDAIEQIDIGGPTMIRAAAKNYQYTTILIDPNDYTEILNQILEQGNTTINTREQLAAKAFEHTAAYDATIAHYLQNKFHTESSTLPKQFSLHFKKYQDLSYGENPHQMAALYREIHSFLEDSNLQLLQGKPLSFNNIIDSETAMRCALSLGTKDLSYTCVIVKHAMPCGAAKADSLLNAYKLAYQTDPISAFGGIIAFNHPLDADTVKSILEQQFVEVIIAKDFSTDALKICQQKPNLRVICCREDAIFNKRCSLQPVADGWLVQNLDDQVITQQHLQCVSDLKPSQTQINDLLFAWNIVKFVKSNAIVFARDLTTLGIGGGQTSRVFSTEIGILKAKQAGLSLTNAVMASDAFLPFADNVEMAAANGITAIIQTGGSKRDKEVIAAANQAKIAMVFTGFRHFLH